MCPTCHILQPRGLCPADLSRPANKPTIAASSCRRCRAKHLHRVPQPDNIPLPLKDLTPEIIEALRPFDIDVGPETRAPNGYRKKVRMIPFSWAFVAVKEKIKSLSCDHGRKAKATLSYRQGQTRTCEYHDYYDRHTAFLTSHNGKPTPQQARRPLHFIEEVGLETALWPHLYWETTMCKSYERLSDQRLQRLQGRQPYPQGMEETKDEDDGEEGDRRHCIKRSF